MTLLQKLEEYIKIDEEIETFFNEECEIKSCEKGEILSNLGKYNKHVFYVNKGVLRSFYYEKGKEITTNFYLEGKIVASIETLFKGLPSKNNIECIVEGEITTCHYTKLEELCSKSLQAANFSRFILGNIMTQMTGRIATLQHKTAKEKYTELLENNPNIILEVPLKMIAGYLGISQETLSRIRSDI